MRAKRQRGFLLIAAVILIAVAATMALVMVTLTAGSSQAGALQLNSTQALFIAESGLERGIYSWGADNTYAGEGPVTFAGGSYTITTDDLDFSGLPLASGKHIISVGTIGSNPGAQRRVEAIVTGGALFYDSFTATTFGNWAGTYTNNQGNFLFAAATNCPTATCPGSGNGSIVIQTFPNGSNQRFIGYIETTLTANIVTGAGLTVDAQIGFWKTGNNVNTNTFSLTLVTTGGVQTQLVSDAAETTAGWVLGTATVALPAGRTYNRVRLYFDLREQGNNQVLDRFDEIKITTPGGTTTVSRQAWREVFP